MQTKRVAIYARVSTKDQKERKTVENQMIALRDYCASRGYEVFREYVDEGWSGARRKRPKLEQLFTDAGAGEFSIVLVWSFDRFARSTRQLLDALEFFRVRDIDFIALQTSIDTSTPIGKVFFTMVAAMAEFEREMIRQRVMAGLTRARMNGKRLGRKAWKVTSDMRTRVVEMHSGGSSTREIAREIGLASSYVWRIIHKSRSQITSFESCEILQILTCTTFRNGRAY